MREDLERGGGALASMSDRIIGCLRFESELAYLHVRRVAVDPAWQRQGVGTALMQWAHDYARTGGLAEVRIGVRLQLPGNLRFYQQLGYQVLAEHRHPGYNRVTWVEMGRPV